MNAFGVVEVKVYCECGTRWSIVADGQMPVGDLNHMLWREHGRARPGERHREATPEECRRERNRRARQIR